MTSIISDDRTINRKVKKNKVRNEDPVLLQEFMQMTIGKSQMK